MSDSIAGTVIDCLEFARSGGVLERRIALDEMPRLADQLAATDGFLSVRLAGSRDGEGKSWLQVAVAGEPVLRCQRCLGGVKFGLEIFGRLQLIAPGEEWPDEDLADDSIDAIPAGKELAVLELIEDEVLLALPIAPMHGQCDPPSAGAEGQEASPFAALAVLKKKH